MKKQLVIIALLTAISQLAAFIKLWFTARLFGISAELDGYNLALVLPTLITGVISGALQTGLFPVRAKLATEQNTVTVEQFERSVLLGLLLLGCSLAALAFLLSPFLYPLFTSSTTEPVQAALNFVIPFAVILIIFNLPGDALGYLLALRNRYPIAAAAPIANGIVGTTLLAAWPEGGLLNLALGTVLGLTAQVAICAIGLRQTGFRLFRKLPSWLEMGHERQEMLRLGGWILPGVVFSNLLMSLPPLLIAQYGEGAVSAFGYAYRLHASVIQLIIMASSTVILAKFSELVAHNNYTEIQKILFKSAKISLFIGILSLTMVWLLGAIILEEIFSGKFDTSAAEKVAKHWLWLTLAIPFLIQGNFLAKLLQAQKKVNLIVLISGIGFCTFLITQITLHNYLLEYSIPASLTASGIIIFISSNFGTQQKSK